MPGRDGTGPRGSGLAGGRGGRFNAGPDGNCVCPKCGEKVPHRSGFPCTSVKCTKCDSLMIRE